MTTPHEKNSGSCVHMPRCLSILQPLRKDHNGSTGVRVPVTPTVNRRRSSAV